MIAKTLEVGARAIAVSYGEDPDDYASLLDICGPNNEPLLIWEKYTDQAQACIEAAITTGSLVPASAVADMRERWTQAIRDLRELVLAGDLRRIDRRCFDLIMFGPGEAQAGGDYVVVPRGAAHDVWAVESGGSLVSLWLSEENANKVLASYQRSKPSGRWTVVKLVALLNAATGAGDSSSSGSEE